MSKYLKNLVTELEFDGEKISVTLAPIKYKDTLRFNSLPTITDDKGEKTLSHESIVELMQDIVPEYVLSIRGLTDANGAVLEPKDIFGVAYFSNLITEIGTSLVLAGTPPRTRKPDGQKGGCLPGSRYLANGT